MTGVHPAVFSDNLLPTMAAMLGDGSGGLLLDPCAGLGHKLAQLAGMADWLPYGLEIEEGYREFANECVRFGDATCIDSETYGIPSRFDAAVTSFVYPNGMADNFHAKDDSTRHTYVHRLRAKVGADYELADNNMAKTNPRRSLGATRRFYDIQRRIIDEVFRVLIPGAPFVVNTKDTKYTNYTWLTIRQLLNAGFHIEGGRRIPAHGLNHGKGHEGKADFEDLTLARRPA